MTAVIGMKQRGVICPALWQIVSHFLGGSRRSGIDLEGNAILLDGERRFAGERKRGQQLPIGQVPTREAVAIKMPGIRRLGVRQHFDSQILL